MLSRWLKGLMAGLVFAGANVALSAPPVFAQTTTLSGFGEGTLQRNFSMAGVPLLKSFFFDFGAGEDHNILHVSVYPETNGTITLAFENNDGDDEFFYNIEYGATAASGTVLGSTSGVCKDPGACTLAIARPSPPSDYVFVLRGFRIFYHGEDHHIDEIALYESNGQLHVRFNDKHKDKTYIWYARWAWVPRSRFGTIGTVHGSSCDSNPIESSCARDWKEVPAGAAVIRGFRFNFKEGDRYLSNMGLFTRNSGAIEAYFADNSENDEFSWFVRYAVLAPTFTISPVAVDPELPIDPTP
jgi:hypothetical protein